LDTTPHDDARITMSARSALLALSKRSTAFAPMTAHTIGFKAYSTVIEGLKYAASHEWAKIEGDVATIGITDHAQVRARRQPLGGPQLDRVVRRRVSDMH